MSHIIYSPVQTPQQQLLQMQEDARFDVADEEILSIREDIRSPKAPPKVPKVFLSNHCVFNCAYCTCRSSRDCRRYQLDPRELAELAVNQALAQKRGIFLTSAIFQNPDYTEELIIRTLQIIRQDLGFQGYVHAKVMPGTDPQLIYQAGLLANRLSVNIEVAHSDGYLRIAHNKNKRNILTPMGQIHAMIRQARLERSRFAPAFATTQTTQLMAGSTGEDDHTILRLSDALYRKYELNRVYYTAYEYDDHAAGYEDLPETHTPKWRVKRLYQADRLLQLYDFTPDEIAPQESPFLSETLDPKAAWALRHLHLFPVEVNRADFETLIRIPGIGITYAQRILRARRHCTITHDVLKALGVSLKRSVHFLTCAGKYRGGVLDSREGAEKVLADAPAKADKLPLANVQGSLPC